MSARGGNPSFGPAPEGACEFDNRLYCPGESYRLEGTCASTCTCGESSTFVCEYDARHAGACKVDSCEVGWGMDYDVDSTWDLADGCTRCTCTDRGSSCDSTECDRRRRCEELVDEYVASVAAASRCDPTSSVPQCAARVRAVLECDGDVAVNSSVAPDELARRYEVHGCRYFNPTTCLPLIDTGSRVVCSPEGYCSVMP